MANLISQRPMQIQICRIDKVSCTKNLHDFEMGNKSMHNSRHV